MYQAALLWLFFLSWLFQIAEAGCVESGAKQRLTRTAGIRNACVRLLTQNVLTRRDVINHQNVKGLSHWRRFAKTKPFFRLAWNGNSPFYFLNASCCEQFLHANVCLLFELVIYNQCHNSIFWWNNRLSNVECQTSPFSSSNPLLPSNQQPMDSAKSTSYIFSDNLIHSDICHSLE